MNLVTALTAVLLALVLLTVGATRFGAWLTERRYPPVGSFAEVRGTRLHFVHVPAPAEPALPPIVFLHGASANLNDAMVPLRPLLEGRAEMLFVDRPGHGWSSRGPDNETPHGQARTIAALMDRLAISRAIIVGHSFGSTIAATFALDFPERTAGLVFQAPASHPWPGGETSWYYSLTAMPLVGRLFAETVATLAARLRIDGAVDCVFSPNRTPDLYLKKAAIALLLRPSAFRANAVDVAGLHGHVVKVAPRYRDIRTPSVVISGDRDTVVYEEIHSVGLGRDIPGAELIWVHNMGHKPDWIAPELTAAAIEKVAGEDRDLEAVARAVEARIATDAYGPLDACPDPKPFGEAQPQN